MAREIAVKITGDTKDLERALSRGQKSAGQFEKSLSKASKFAMIGLGGLAVGAGLAVRAASNLTEQINKTNVVFRGSEKAILNWSKTTASGFGISQRAALEAAGTFGNMLVPMGIARDEAGKMSQRFVELAADMASFNNASPEETLDALRSGLAGETEPLRKFGVFLNAARIEQEALNLGLKKGKQPLDAAAKAQATYSIILKDTADAQGDFTRTSDSLANQERILRAELEDTAAALGTALLPAATAMAGKLLELVQFTREHGTETKIAGVAIAGFAGAIVLANASLAIYNSSLLLAVKATRTLRLAMAATPFLAAVTAVGFLVEAFLNQKNKADDATEAQRKLTDAVKDYHKAISEGKQARRDMEGANLRLEAAEISLKRAMQDRTRTQKDANASALDRRESDLRVAQAAQEVRDAQDAVRMSTDKFLNSQRNQIHATNEQKVQIEGLAKTFRQKLQKATEEQIVDQQSLTVKTQAGAVSLGAAKANADAYAGKLRGLAKVAEKSNPKLAETARLAAALASAWARVVSLPEAKRFIARFSVITTVEEHRASVGRAAGGPVSAGRPYMVGERGPELFVPNGNGRIIPNGGGGGGGGQFALIWAGPDFLRWMEDQQRRQRRSGRLA